MSELIKLDTLNLCGLSFVNYISVQQSKNDGVHQLSAPTAPRFQGLLPGTHTRGPVLMSEPLVGLPVTPRPG